LRLPGQWKDPSWSTAAYPFELYYNLHRWYDPATGRYISVDPLGLRADPNPFLYAAGRPSFFTDPFGLVRSKGDCKECCTEEDKAEEIKRSAAWLDKNWRSYMWTPSRVLGGGSCLTAAMELQDGFENEVKPECWVTSVQLTKRFGADFFKALCGIYFPVHYVVKYAPCDDKGDDYYFDAYLGPDWGPLAKEKQLDEP
jgi:RHS repeat-associated protein